ncbi:MAG TPA: heparan-alpha-glucosaminide N-acetyltransferase [Methanothrix sp.]|jgi:uncharacterized membrane protein|nr:DUF1624 domain-containing protein [Methanothrix sp.]HPY72241.1 heparan-alpha-glucosaminide N-acetyltransferase [Methanothrix sp.]HQA62747.1 heparan-alpha-glucosaminide N-acetyltransferase [Methanothrix sp.]
MTRRAGRNEALAGRYWEIDLLRGIAVLMMIGFHALYDLAFFSGPAIVDVRSGAMPTIAEATASIFLLLVGLSLTISSARAGFLGWDRLLFRGIGIFSWGMAVTLSTFLVLEEGFVVFGILHLIGISVILSLPILHRPRAALLLGAAVIPAGLILRGQAIATLWLLPLGLVPVGFYSVDYFPLLPWFGVVLVGIFLGSLLYPGGERRLPLPEISPTSPARLICLLGRNSLPIYLLHQPVLIVAMGLFGIIDIGRSLALPLP